MSIESLDPKQFIIIKGAKENNLKNIDVAIPRNKMVVVTGLSGSGKSSLAFDTLFAEGQRMYVESLSSYARQFLGRMEKPNVEYIKGVSPAIAIEQKVNTRNPRSTVGTSTEIYDYLKLLFARIGITYSPVSGEPVTKDSVTAVVDYIERFNEGTRIMVLCPFKVKEGRTLQQELNIVLQKGFTRLLVNDTVAFIEDIISNGFDGLAINAEDAKTKKKKAKPEDYKIEVLIDRTTVNPSEEENRYRIADSVQTAFFEGEGVCTVVINNETRKVFSDKFEKDGIVFEEPSVNLFSFNNPYGACKTCEGFGTTIGIDEDLVVPDKSLSVYEGAIAPWRTESMGKFLVPLLKNGIRFDFPIHRAYIDLNEQEKEILWNGNEYFQGIWDFFKWIESQSHQIQYRVLLSRYRGRTICPECKGTRLRKDASYVKINGKSISELVLMSIDNVALFFEQLTLDPYQAKVAQRLVTEITHRVNYLQNVGLGYLTLNRLSSTLSGGEFQRIKLATCLGSALVGSMYILDEPSIGLHPRDTHRLISVLKKLRDAGNTVIVVEHEEEVMRSADQVIDIGPDAGSHGGQLMFQGTLDELQNNSVSHTARYLNGKDEIEVPKQRRKWKDSIIFSGIRENNRKNVEVEIPLGVLTAITGVSGSGKSTLVKKIIYPSLAKLLGIGADATGKFDKMEGDYKLVKQIEFVDQNPIGKSSRSNPVTYVKAYDAIRQLFSEIALAKQRGYKPQHFSFNVEGGRCEMCQGEGTIEIEMQFMANIRLTCEGCGGKRFKEEVLEVKYKDKNISEVLELTVDDSIAYFAGNNAITSKLKPLQEVGLGYITLGQSSSSLSGGEAQRVKLASFLGKGGISSKGNILFIFDEPTTGLHFHDIKKLLFAMNALVEQGNTVLLIEHNMEMVKSADWIIDLGPEGGENGGRITFTGTPEEMVKLEGNHTASFLREKI